MARPCFWLTKTACYYFSRKKPAIKKYFICTPPLIPDNIPFPRAGKHPATKLHQKTIKRTGWSAFP